MSDIAIYSEWCNAKFQLDYKFECATNRLSFCFYIFMNFNILFSGFFSI